MIFLKIQSYVVYLGAHSHGPEVTSSDLDEVTNSHHQLLSTVLGSPEKARKSIFYSYKRYINGFAAVFDTEVAEELSKHPDVVSVFENQRNKLQTTRSWSFLGLESDSGEQHRGSAWEKARYGADTIIGNIDSGVWPESQSFNDAEMGPIPPRWKGFCQNKTKYGVSCNKKLIGARYFLKGIVKQEGRANLSLNNIISARDYYGHGTHTLSTAGGSFVSGVNVSGLGNGTAKGGSPKARVASYKVCWYDTDGQQDCPDCDILSAFEAAIHDGVDVISVSVGASIDNYFIGGINIGGFHAVMHGITVVTAAGNSNLTSVPPDESVFNVAPWLLTVGATTMDREFPVKILLGNGKQLKGQGLSRGPLLVHPLINGSAAKAANSTDHDAQLCLAQSLDPAKVEGKVVVCLRSMTDPKEIGGVAQQSGAAGMILANDDSTGKSPDVSMTRPKTRIGGKPAPDMLIDSRKGPNTVTAEILKPDISAPGDSIIAAFPPPVGSAGETENYQRYVVSSGTSMACPHISGVVGLLKTLHPDWSPSAIKSAIMTTARTRNSEKVAIRNSSDNQATPFNYGSGQVRPNAAMNPGLVYDLTTNDYLNFLCGVSHDKAKIKAISKAEKRYKCPKSYNLANFNYPSITVPLLHGSITVTRTLKNVGSPGTYKTRIRAPPRIKISVEPKKLTFDKMGEEKVFTMNLKARQPSNEAAFGRLTWTDGKHHVRSPIVVMAVTV
ncbi:hypothetical protein C5167_045045 [Papaver somniferum]|uniref:Subtilisin-like protease n=1 Tax=Papaver somniferum TaxID=3469 RepID=A0A4Y7LDI9_PAPSO|nr:hypothetical protein C5167_045045 [Papaver somniferum]